MQERKNKILMSSLVGLLLVIALFYIFQNKDDRSIDKGIFKPEDTSTINKVTLESGDNKVELVYSASGWKVNQYDADEQLVTVLFATLAQAEPKRPAAANLADSIRNYLHTKGVKVSWMERGEEERTIWIGGNKDKTITYFQNTDSGPYITSIPGYHVYVGGIFELSESEWRDKRIFNFNWRNFKQLTAHFENDPKQKFTIEDRGEGFEVVELQQTDTARLNGYLDAVSLLMVDRYIAPGYNEAYDSLIANANPTVTIEVLDAGNNVRKLELYAPLKTDRFVLGKSGKSDLVLFDREQVIPILKSREYFRRVQP